MNDLSLEFLVAGSLQQDLQTLLILKGDWSKYMPSNFQKRLHESICA